MEGPRADARRARRLRGGGVLPVAAAGGRLRGRRSTEGDAVDETDDAIGDHNEIRDAVPRPAGTRRAPTLGAAVRRAREENDDHLAEEEHDALPDFRRNASDALRAELALRWLDWRYAHDSGEGITYDKDPEEYIAEHTP